MEEQFILPRRQLVSAIEDRVRELLDMVRDELKKIGKDGLLPAGVVISGGGAKLPGFAALVKETLGLPVRGARPLQVEAFEAAMDPALAVATGLIVWGFGREVGEDGQMPSAGSPVFGWLGKFGDWLKNFLP